MDDSSKQLGGGYFRYTDDVTFTAICRVVSGAEYLARGESYSKHTYFFFMCRAFSPVLGTSEEGMGWGHFKRTIKLVILRFLPGLKTLDREGGIRSAKTIWRVQGFPRVGNL